MDAGGLAQMSYNNFNSIGVPNSGFASRGKGAHIKRLSFEPSAIDHGVGVPTPRTSRSHLLAGLRTAPKSATFPPSAPPTQLHHRTGIESSMYADKQDSMRGNYGGAKTSIGSHFPSQQVSMNNNRQMYSLPEQVLAPPEIQMDEHAQDQMDPGLYAQLVATNMYLAEQQQRLQQQLRNVQAAAQQFQGLNLGQINMQQQFATPPITPSLNMYQQQFKQQSMQQTMQQNMQQNLQQNMQPIVTAVPTQPGMYTVYNPMTGQQSYYFDQNVQNFNENQQQVYDVTPPQQASTPRFQVSPPSNAVPLRSISPPKKSLSPPQDHSPLPPPSANAFRRGHKKATSLANVLTHAPDTIVDGPRTAVPKTAGILPASTNGSFGPGQARAGEHPTRQPRGPPSLDELLAKPTTKFEGSKNFATRQRRSAVHNLVRAGLERRRGPGSGSGSSGSITPISEAGEITFSVASDNDSDSGRSGSGSLSGRPSLGGSRTSAHGAIGSDRPSSRQKERSQDQTGVSGTAPGTPTYKEEMGAVDGTFAAVFKNAGKKIEAAELPRKAPMLVLSSVDKRKSMVF